MLRSVCVVSLLLAPLAAGQATFQVLRSVENPTDLSGDGSTVVGFESSGAYVWTQASGKFFINDLPGPLAIDHAGTWIAGNFLGPDGESLAGRWSEATGWMALPGFPAVAQPPDLVYHATDISADGSAVVGYARFGPLLQRAFRWEQRSGTMDLSGPWPNMGQALAVSRNGSHAVGFDVDPETRTMRPALWTTLGAGPSILALDGWATDINRDCTVVVGTTNYEAFRWTAMGGLQKLGVLPGHDKLLGDATYAEAVSGDGTTVAGAAIRPWEAETAFLWRADLGGMWSLEELLAAMGAEDELEAWDLRRVVALSTDGRTILGMAVPAGTWGPEKAFLATLPAQPRVYCNAKVNSLGCTPHVGWLGYPSATERSGFQIHCDLVRNHKAGLLAYSLDGRAEMAFRGGTLCVAPPIRRSPVMDSGGTGGGVDDCSGRFVIDMNAFALGDLGGNPVPGLHAFGTRVTAQFWGRDPGFMPPNDVTLSDALDYVVGL